MAAEGRGATVGQDDTGAANRCSLAGASLTSVPRVRGTPRQTDGSGGYCHRYYWTRAFQSQLNAMTLPRVLITLHMMGKPLGPPNNRETQREVLLEALDLLEAAEQVGSFEYVATMRPSSSK